MEIMATGEEGHVGCYGPSQDGLLEEIAEVALLPEDFQVYVRGNTVINHPACGFKARTLPTVNHYKGEHGGYVALYSRQKEGSIYSVGGGINVMGQVRIPGHYEGRIFVPEGYELGDNITRDEKILEICRQYFPDLEDFWVGGDTGGWYGIQP